MAIIDLRGAALGRNMQTQRRRLAVLRYMLRGYTAHEAHEVLSKLAWWRGWTQGTVENDMRHLKKYIRTYGKELPEVQEAIAWALSYYEDAMKEYDMKANQYEAQGADDLAIRYRAMRDALANKAFKALGISDLNLNIQGNTGNSFQAVAAFFGIDGDKNGDGK